jgi:hypothetical protein
MVSFGSTATTVPGTAIPARSGNISDSRTINSANRLAFRPFNAGQLNQANPRIYVFWCKALSSDMDYLIHVIYENEGRTRAN